MIQVPLQPFLAFVLVFLRTVCLLSFFPVLGERFLPVRLRVMLSAAIAVALMSMAPVNAAHFPMEMGGIVRLVATEALLGIGLAFIGRVMFAVVQYSGQIMGQEIGFGLVNSLDPHAHQVTIVAEMQYMLALLLFFAAGLHHIVLLTLANSFEVLPPGTMRLTTDLAGFMLDLGRTLFSLALGFAMPVIAINFAINVAMGLVGRAVPQMNVFIESFPLRIIAGLAVLMLSLGFTAELWMNMFNEMGGQMEHVLKLMR